MKIKKILKTAAIVFAILIAILIILLTVFFINVKINKNREEKEIAVVKNYIFNYFENKYPDDNFSNWEYTEYGMFAGLDWYKKKGYYDSGSARVESEKYGKFFCDYVLNDYVSSDYFVFTLQPKIEEYVNNLLLELPEDIRKTYNFSVTSEFDYLNKNYEDWTIGDILRDKAVLDIEINVENSELSAIDKQKFMGRMVDILYNNPDISYSKDRNGSFYVINFIFSDGETVKTYIRTNGNVDQFNETKNTQE
jgi:hypothetical protein